MPTTGNDILAYEGNPLVGSGANASIPVSTTKDLDAVNRAGENAMWANMQQQKDLFDRKVKDHNQLLNLLSSGDLKIGDHLDRDTPTVTKALDSLDAANDERSKKGFNNLEAKRKYDKALRDANMTITQAQSRFVVDKQVQQDIANAETQEERDAIKAEHDKYLNNFNSDYIPHVKAITIDHPGMVTSQQRDALVSNSGITTQPKMMQVHKQVKKIVNGKLTTVDEVTEQPIKTMAQKGTTSGSSVGADGKLSIFSNVPGKHWDFGIIKANTADDFHDPKQRKNQLGYVDFLLNPENDPRKTNVPQLQSILDHANSRFSDYNNQNNLTGDNKLTALKIFVDPDTGQRQIVDENDQPLSVTDINARMALAAITGDYVEADKSEFNKPVADYLENVRSAKAREANDRNRLGLDWTKFNYAKDEDKYGASSVLNEAKDIIDKGVETDVYNKSTGKVEKHLRVGDPTLLKTFGTIDKDGNVTNVPDYLEYNKDKDQITIGYYAPQRAGQPGKNIEREVSLDQRTWLKEIAKRSFPNKDLGTVNTLVDDILNKNSNSLYKLTQSGKGTNTLVFPDGSQIDLSTTTLTDKEIKAAIKAGAKQQ